MQDIISQISTLYINKKMPYFDNPKIIHWLKLPKNKFPASAKVNF